jgi:quercetin dioxygenase-like cupin family protein
MVNTYRVIYTPAEMKAMIDTVMLMNTADPTGRINNTTGKKKEVGSQHTISLRSIVFDPLIDAIHKIGYQNLNNFVVTDIWTNYNPPGGFNKKHYHVGADIAGCFYLVVPENSGKIEFETGESITPKSGDLFWWNGNIEHWVLTNESSYDRISIAFNIRKI